MSHPQKFIIIQVAELISTRRCVRPKNKQESRRFYWHINRNLCFSQSNFRLLPLSRYFHSSRSGLTAHTHALVSGFRPVRGNKLQTHIHVLQNTSAEDICGIPRGSICQEISSAACCTPVSLPGHGRGICFQMVELMVEIMWECLCDPRLGWNSGKAALREWAS